MAKEHILKTVGTCWDAVAAGLKQFEVRRNDRFFQSGDVVVLRRIDDAGHYCTDPTKGKFSTMDLRFRIGWTLQGGQFGIETGYIVFQLEPLEATPAPQMRGQ
jgi:hypothetical protein